MRKQATFAALRRGVRGPRRRGAALLLAAMLLGVLLAAGWGRAAEPGIEFFERRIRPVLVAHCYKCHSADAAELKGGLRLDLRAGWQLGGESGEPAIQPGRPDDSLLIRAVRHEDGVSAMPPDEGRLPDDVVRNLVEWVRMGAPDPREGTVAPRDRAADWQAEFQRRLAWWSLQPLCDAQPPQLAHTAWVKTDVDRFILAALEARGLQPAAEAEPQALVRRLSFALTGLPPDVEMVEQFAADGSPQAYERLVDMMLESPHFGERWARHWMDVVHYADTHGYEWDVPAKHAWRYRDYLVRAFNADVPYRQLVLEQLAGDLIEPRIDPATGLNEALIGPLMLRLGERRHGDNAAAEGVTQEAVANMIDTIGKAFLGMTLACAQCHDHKLDAVEQRDYYALAGVLMSTRFSPRTLDAVDPNIAVIEELRQIKGEIRAELARLWLAATELQTAGGMAERIRAIAADTTRPTAFPSTLVEFWKRSLTAPVTAEEFQAVRTRRVEANTRQLTLMADFSRADGAAGWRWDGLGMKHGLAADGEIVVADEGDAAVLHLLPAGRYSHVWSPRLAGWLHSPHFDPTMPVTFSVEVLAGKFAAYTFVIDRALHSERLQFLNRPSMGWLTLTAGDFASLEGSPDKTARLVYLELATKDLNNYFPPRVNYNGLNEAEIQDPRSWFGVSRVVRHAPGQAPEDELTRFVPLFEGLQHESDWSRRLTLLLRAAVERWTDGTCTGEDVRLLNDALHAKLLPNDLQAHPTLAALVAQYREVERRIQPDRTAGSVAEWYEGRNERVAIRGSYTDLGEEVERGSVRILGGPIERANASASGRLELAQQIADQRNPLTARVYVNRVWHYLFGEGLVRTPDDFGHLGERPTHPELLDYLARRFMAEGWSTKRLVRLLVTSAVWRQRSVPAAEAVAVDPENRLWHHMPMRRLEAEAIRDAMLKVAGRLHPALFGPPIDPYRTAEDAQKRLFCGPLDGDGRRSLYIKMTLMEPPRFLALFNQPIPKLTVGRRDVTNVPDQALAMLNDPFVLAMARHWSERLMQDGAASPQERAGRMFAAALARPPRQAEIERLVRLVRASAQLRGADSRAVLACQAAWQDAAHAIFNLKEFIYVP